MKTLFQKIIDRELEAKILWEDEKIIVIEDIHPQAPVHVLLIPKKPIQDLQHMTEEDRTLLPLIVEVAQMLSKKLGIEQGYRLLTNNGEQAGQTIFHLHFHLLGGKPFSRLV